MILDNPITLLIMKRKLIIRFNRLPNNIQNAKLRTLYLNLIHPMNAIIVSMFRQDFSTYVKDKKQILWQAYREDAKLVSENLKDNLKIEDQEISTAEQALYEHNVQRFKSEEPKFNLFDLIHLRWCYEFNRLHILYKSLEQFKLLLVDINTEDKNIFSSVTDKELIEEFITFIDEMKKHLEQVASKNQKIGKLRLLNQYISGGRSYITEDSNKFYSYPFSMHATYYNSVSKNENKHVYYKHNMYLMLAALFTPNIIPSRQRLDPLVKLSSGETCHGKTHQWAWAIQNNSSIAVENISTKQSVLTQYENQTYDIMAGRKLDSKSFSAKTSADTYYNNIKKSITDFLKQINPSKTYLIGVQYKANALKKEELLTDDRNFFLKLFVSLDPQITQQYTSHAFGIRCIGEDGQGIEFYDSNNGIMQFKSHHAFVDFFMCFQALYAKHLKGFNLFELPYKNNLEFKYSDEFAEFQKLDPDAKQHIATELKDGVFNDDALLHKDNKTTFHDLLNKQINLEKEEKILFEKYTPLQRFGKWLFIDLRILIVPMLYDLVMLILKARDNYVLSKRANKYAYKRKEFIKNYTQYTKSNYNIMEEKIMEQVFSPVDESIHQLFANKEKLTNKPNEPNKERNKNKKK